MVVQHAKRRLAVGSPRHAGISHVHRRRTQPLTKQQILVEAHVVGGPIRPWCIVVTRARCEIADRVFPAERGYEVVALHISSTRKAHESWLQILQLLQEVGAENASAGTQRHQVHPERPVMTRRNRQTHRRIACRGPYRRGEPIPVRLQSSDLRLPINCAVFGFERNCHWSVEAGTSTRIHRELVRFIFFYTNAPVALVSHSRSFAIGRIHFDPQAPRLDRSGWH
jgi:hypothetical protein